MKIAFLNIYGDRVSRGAEVAVNQLATRLAKEHQVVIFQSAFTGIPTSQKRASLKKIYLANIPIISTEVSQNLILRILKKFYLDPYSLLVFYFSLRCLPFLLKGNFDVLLPINGFWQLLVCKLVKLLRGGKIVVMGYAGIGVDDWVNLKLGPDAFFAMSDYAAKWAKKVNTKVKVAVIPGGVDTSKFHPQVKPRKLPLKPPIVLTVAALVPYKRLDLTIKAVARVPLLSAEDGRRQVDKNYQFSPSLVIAGNGPLKSKIEKLGKKLLGKRFLRLDINFAELPHLYTACDVFTLASMHTGFSFFEKLTGQKPSEAFGIVYVEAMACGLPVVAPADPLRREIVGGGGILVDCNNIDEYAKALKKALNSRWGEKPRRQAKKFEWDKLAMRFSTALAKL